MELAPQKRIINEYTPYNIMNDAKLRRIIASYGIIVGIMMIVQWAVFIVLGEVEELESESTRIAFHLAAEFGTATALVVGGLAILKTVSWGYHAFLVSQGMLAYTIIVSPGYFAQNGEFAFVAMFATLWIMTIVVIVTSVRQEAVLRGEGQANDPTQKES